MKAWTYTTAPERGPFWKSNMQNIVLLEYPDGRLEWRHAETGDRFYSAGDPGEWHKGQLLDPHYYPQWYRDLDDLGTDVGL